MKISTILLAALAVPTLAYKANLFDVKQDLIKYVDVGEYEYDQWQAVRPAIAYISHHDFEKNSAVVFDIDETLLSNYDSMLAFGFGGNSEIFHENEIKADAKLIPASSALFKLAKAKKLNIFIITGRGKMVAKATKTNLSNAGIKDYNKIIFWAGKTPLSVMQYKSGARCALEKAGYKIVMNVGDQESDFSGPCRGNMVVKLPNPFYKIPANQLKKSLKY